MVQNIVEFAFADGIENQAMLFAKQMFLLRIPYLTFVTLAAVGGGFFAYAAAADEDLGLQKKFTFARLALPEGRLRSG